MKSEERSKIPLGLEEESAGWAQVTGNHGVGSVEGIAHKGRDFELFLKLKSHAQIDDPIALIVFVSKGSGSGDKRIKYIVDFEHKAVVPKVDPRLHSPSFP